MDPEALLQKYPIISEQVEKKELGVILREFAAILSREIPGSIVEFGCYTGTTSLFLQRMAVPEKRELYVYDSFEGLPEKTLKDHSPAGQQFVAGKLSAKKQELIRNFKKAGLPLPKITKAWFKDLGDNDIPVSIAFAFLDGDYYDSILDPLKLIWPRLSSGAVVLVDDYQNEALPGASRAVDEWLVNHDVRTFRVEQSMGIMHI